MNVPERVLTEELPVGWWMLTVTRKNPGKFRRILRLDSGPEGSVKSLARYHARKAQP